jgi:hypothetical protein
VQALRVDAVGDSGQTYGGRAFRDCMIAARIRHVPVMLVRRGMHYVTDDGITLDALGPVYRRRRRTNGCTHAHVGRRSRGRRADILKVGHDASAYSSTPAFIAAIQPRYALIGLGRHNLFGHPAQTTLTTLHQLSATVYRTDRCGAISVEAGPTITVTPMLSCR